MPNAPLMNDLSESNLPECLFCIDNMKDRVVDEFETVYAIKDQNPVSDGHHLIIPKKHTQDWFSMTERERNDADRLIRILKKRLSRSDKKITGFNIGTNVGESVGQIIFHAHIHLIPRRDGDTKFPNSAVKGQSI